MSTYIVDIDGTLADCEHRRHFIDGKRKDWDGFFADAHNDTPFEHMQRLLQDLDANVVYVSGRPERLRTVTEDWLVKHGFPFPRWLYMRKDGDRRPDTDIKLELLAVVQAKHGRITMAFDDRDSVVEMWRENGVPCAQVAKGDF